MDNERLNEELIQAALSGGVEGVRYTLSKGADVNAKNNNGATALMAAAMVNSKYIAELLIEEGADTSVVDNTGYTALMTAVVMLNFEVAGFLLEKSGGLGEVKKQMQDAIKQEKDPTRRLEMKIDFTRIYKKIHSRLGKDKETKLGDVKTLKLPPKNKGKFRIKRVTNG